MRVDKDRLMKTAAIVALISSMMLVGIMTLTDYLKGCPSSQAVLHIDGWKSSWRCSNLEQAGTR